MKIKELQDLVSRLNKILKKPEPGLFTWHAAVDDLIRELATKYGLPVSTPERK